MGRQGTVYLIELFPTGGSDGDGDTQIVSSLAGAQLDRGGVKTGVELPGDVGDGSDQSLLVLPHDLDRKLAGIGDQRCAGLVLMSGRLGGHGDECSED